LIKDIPSTSDSIRKYGLNAKKSLGQNFILDSNLTDKIARQAGSLEDYHVLEIGPGPGGLTKSILRQNPKKLTVIEQDDRCVEALQEVQQFYPEKLQIIKGDALKFNIDELLENPQQKIKIIANLPYNIGTKLLFEWLKNRQNIEQMVLLLQKEVVQRIVAQSGDKTFGRLAVMINFFCKTKKLFDIAPSCFVPAPKVTSSLVSIEPLAEPIMDVDFKSLEKICAAAFLQRRKMIKSALKNIYPDTQNWLKKCNINPSLRAEQLKLEDFGRLSLSFKNY
jgi:16S rRNA (adenine1518-N6/adenine1519-N6)-dimethyltransferase